MIPLDPYTVKLEKSTLIEAGAGTGKTYTITTLFLRLIAGGYPVESILVVTFTEAAAAELKLRIRKRLADTLDAMNNPSNTTDELSVFLNAQAQPELIRNRLLYALVSFDQAAVMTIHSFCFKILKEFAFESRSFFDVELMADRSSFLLHITYDFFLKHVNHLDPLFLAFLRTVNVTPEQFIKTFRQVLSNPRLKCIPPVEPFHDFFEEYRQTISAIQKMLQNDFEGIMQTVSNAKGLDKRSYSKKNVPNWLDVILEKIKRDGQKTLFVMEETADAAYKFTHTRLASKTKPGFESPRHEFFDLCEKLLGDWQRFKTNLIHLKYRYMEFFRAAHQKARAEKGFCFFDDLINDLAQALKGAGQQSLVDQIRRIYKACLIDEFQDTDAGQYSIFSRIFAGSGPFFMIGDPKQAIYGFRGGDIFTYLTASGHSEQQFTLDTNYRSAPLLVKGINRLFSSTDHPFGYERIEFNPSKTPVGAANRLKKNNSDLPPVTFCFLNREDFDPDRQGFISRQEADAEIPEYVADDMVRLFESTSDIGICDKKERKTNGVSPADVAVLVRTNAQARKIQSALASRQIPSYISKSGSVFDSVQAIELMDILVAVFRCDHFPSIKAALCTSVFGFSLEKLLSLERDDTALHYWKQLFFDAQNLWKTKGFVPMIMSLLHSEQAFINKNVRVSYRGLTNFYHLTELVSQACMQQQFDPFFLIRWYEKQLIPGLREEFADELRLETDKDAVAIVTIHKSKGLEYPMVYLPYLWDGNRPLPKADVLFHDPKHSNRLTLDFGSKQIENSIEWYHKEDLSEQQRLLYVALTRASAGCRIFWGGIKGCDESALGRLLHPGGCREDQGMLEDIQQLIQGAKDAMAITSVERNSREENRFTGFKTKEEPLKAHCFDRIITPKWRFASFSSLTQGAYPDQDHEIRPAPGKSGDDLTVLVSFPKGAGSGDFFHSVFENIDFTKMEQAAETLIPEQFERFGFSGQDHLAAACTAVEHVLNTRLKPGENAFSLRQIPLDCRLNELSFTFSAGTFSAKDLVRPMGTSDCACTAAGYPQLLGQLSFPSFKGYLKGFIDLIFVYENQYYIVDYKSNTLGETYDDYDHPNMQAAMSSHHYYLQYHIYTVALHKYLSKRLKAYQYEKHFGGVFYLFIRGMHPDLGAERGVFFDRPGEQTIQALCDIF